MCKGKGRKAPREPKGHLLAGEVVLGITRGFMGNADPWALPGPSPTLPASAAWPEVRPAQTREGGWKSGREGTYEGTQKGQEGSEF